MDKFTMAFTENLLDKKIVQAADLVKIDYAISVVKSEFFKTLLLILIFSLMGLLLPFLLLMAVIAPIRMTTGGIHVNNSWGCFSLSLLFTLLQLVILPCLNLGAAVYEGIFIISVLMICLLPLAPSQKRAIKTKEKYIRNKCFSCLLCIFWYFIFHLIVKDSYFIHCGIWAFLMQAIQILYVNVHNKMIKRGISYD